MSAATVNLSVQQGKIASVAPRKKRAVVADDSATILHAICTLLEHHRVVEIVGRAESGPEAINRVGELRPELVLLDADMPGMSGLRTALLISQTYPEIEVLLMSMETGVHFRTACAGCGAAATIYKPRFLQELGAFLQRGPQKARASMGA
jgi:DNA-binding NarL/FixJ family response regulator